VCEQDSIENMKIV